MKPSQPATKKQVLFGVMTIIFYVFFVDQLNGEYNPVFMFITIAVFLVHCYLFGKHSNESNE